MSLGGGFFLATMLSAAAVLDCATDLAAAGAARWDSGFRVGGRLPRGTADTLATVTCVSFSAGPPSSSFLYWPLFSPSAIPSIELSLRFTLRFTTGLEMSLPSFPLVFLCTHTIVMGLSHSSSSSGGGGGAPDGGAPGGGVLVGIGPPAPERVPGGL